MSNHPASRGPTVGHATVAPTAAGPSAAVERRVPADSCLPQAANGTAIAVETFALGKRFGSFQALDAVTVRIRAGTVHALFGENGAGKSTLVKCLVGFHRPDAGSILVNGRETEIPSPQTARALGIGMVYQHFTLVPSMTVAENLALARGKLGFAIRWSEQRDAMAEFMATTPFTLPLDARVSSLSAGQKQKTEIVKQLYARNRFLILDEPTSVLTPGEADEVLGAVRDLAHAGTITALMITHKFREIRAFADDVTVLRRGRMVGGGAVSEISSEQLAEMMIGSARVAAVRPPSPPTPHQPPGTPPLFSITNLQVLDDAGHAAVKALSLAVHAGEIVGIAGVSGNGQRELMQALTGQRVREAGTVSVAGEVFDASRSAYRRQRVSALPEEPLENASVGLLSVAQNMALRDFDRAPDSTAGWLRPGALAARARRLIEEYGIKTRGPQEPIRQLSGGNVQRCILARELSQDARVLLVMNPVFGLDFAAVEEIHRRLREARDRGCAILLVSEDLDELIELSDRVLVMSEGRLVFESRLPRQDRERIGRSMGGHAPVELAA
jgi:simple sugar transport system ATP-binding protein